MAELASPVVGNEIPQEVKKAIPANVAAVTGGDDTHAYDNEYARTVRSLKAQPTVRVKIPKGGEYVQINGWRWWIEEGRVEVPQQVADLLEEAGRI